MTTGLVVSDSAAVTNDYDKALEQLRTFKRRADERLEQRGRAWVEGSLPSSKAPTPADLVEAVTDLTLRGGKRVRPALAYHAALCFEHGLDDEVLLEAVLSVELLQTYLLIHDDLMDEDRERRGGPSTHIALSVAAGDERVGRSLSILAGDMACAMAQELLLVTGLPDARARAGMVELASMQLEVIQGQHLDIVGGATAEAVQEAKTASYTTRGPVLLGAALAGANADQRACLEGYGGPLGVAFQHRDDLLGTFGDQKTLGKPVGEDLREGKRTALVQVALDRADGHQRAAIEAALGKGEANDEVVDAACRAIEQTGSRSWCEDRIASLTKQALSALDGCRLDPKGLFFLQGIALVLADRDR